MKKREVKKQIVKIAGVRRIESITAGRVFCNSDNNYKVKKSWLNNTTALAAILNDLKYNGYDYIPF